MKIIDLSEQAMRLGIQVPKEDSYAIECCGFEQTIDDPIEAKRVFDILIAYYAESQADNRRDVPNEQHYGCSGDT